MKTYRVSTTGRLRAGCLLVILAVIGVYSLRKAIGLWSGTGGKPSDPQIFQLDLNTTVPAALLTLVALSCLAAGWYIVTEWLSQVQLDQTGLRFSAPGYRLFYRWDEIAALEVLQEPETDTPACLRVELLSSSGQATPVPEPLDAPDEISLYLSEADRPANKARRRQQLASRRQQTIRLRKHLSRSDGRPLPVWAGWLYPQVYRPDCLLLYPTLADRAALISEIEQHLARV